MQLLKLQINSGIQLNRGKLAVNKSTLKMRRMHMRSETLGKSCDGSRKNSSQKTQPIFRMEISDLPTEEVTWLPVIKNGTGMSDLHSPLRTIFLTCR